MPIRPATADDLDEVGRLIRELAAYEQLADEVRWADATDFAAHLFGPEPAAHVLLAVTDDAEVAGMALWFRTFSTFLGRPGIWLEDLFVRPEHRGGGHGRALLAELMARSEGRVEWNVLDWNESAIAFYRSLGAAPVDGWTQYRWLPAAHGGSAPDLPAHDAPTPG